MENGSLVTKALQAMWNQTPLSKLGAALLRPDVPVIQETVSKIIKSNLREEWINDWISNKTGKFM